jgi:hypothetical protein
MEEKNNVLKLILGFAGAVLVGIGLLTFVPQTVEPAPQQVSSVSQEQEPVAAEEVGEVAAEQQTVITYQGEEGKTALELLKERAEVTTQTSSFGEYVESINGIKGGTDNKYWIFYINGDAATVGAGEYQTQNDEVIEWRFE